MQLNLENSDPQAKRDVHFAQQPKLEPIEPLESNHQQTAGERTGSKDSMGKGPQPKTPPESKPVVKPNPTLRSRVQPSQPEALPGPPVQGG